MGERLLGPTAPEAGHPTGHVPAVTHDSTRRWKLPGMFLLLQQVPQVS